MSSNIEYALITKVIETKDFHTLQKMQLDESYFTSPEVREVYRFIRQIYNDANSHGDIPSKEMVKLHYPAFPFSMSYDSVPILCTHLRKERMKAELLKLAQEIQEIAEKDPLEAIKIVRVESAKLASLSEVGQDLSISAAYSTLLDRYETVQKSHGMLGIPYPWEQLNEETQGMQPQQFIVLYGRPKSMKTWMGINIGVTAYLKHRKRVLYYTREMGPLLIAQRVAACITKVDYKSYTNGKLQPAIKAAVFETLKDLLEDEKHITGGHAQGPCFIITTDKSAAAGGSGGGVGWLQSKIKDVKPDLVIVDGMYLMKDDRSGQRTMDWKAIAQISQDLKLTAQDFNIPLIGITQANRAADKSKGEDLTELAYSDSLGQDADAVFRVTKKEKIDEDNVKRTELHLTAPGLREGRFDGIVIRGAPATDFTYLRTLVDNDQEEAGGKHDSKYSGSPNGSNGVHKTFKHSSVMDPKIPIKTVKGAS
jgi:replicative DNA helicase